MNISWNLLEQWAKGRGRIPAGCTLEYEFRPSLSWYPNIHTVHAFWIKQNPDKEERLFWHLDGAEQKAVEREYLQSKYKQYTRRAAIDCSWQRFTLTNPQGKKIILQMDRNQHVVELKEVTKPVTFLEVA